MFCEEGKNQPRLRMEYLINRINGNGRYQLALMLMVAFIGIPALFLQTASVFTAGMPKSRCKVTSLDGFDHDVDDEDIKRLFLQWDVNTMEYDSCSHRVYNLSSCESNMTVDCLTNVTLSQTATIKSCVDGYIFYEEVFNNTIVTEWNLLCDRVWMKSLTTSMFYAGLFLGSFFGGIVADRYGRIFTFRLSCVLGLIVGVASTFSPNVYIYALSQLALATLFKPATLSATVYGMEISSTKQRAIGGIGYNITCGLGIIIMGGVAAIFTDWKSFQIAASLAFIPFIIFGIFIPESPRWLISKGKVTEAKAILKKMAKYNHSDIKDEEIAECLHDNNNTISDTEKKISPLEIFARPYMRLVTVCTMIVWFGATMVYYGLCLNSGALFGNVYINHSLGGVMEFVACVSLLYLIPKFGNRTMALVTLSLSTVSCLLSTIAIYIGTGVKAFEICGLVLAMIGRFSSSAAFAVLYMFTLELFPTPGRNTALGLSSMAGRIGSIVTPFTLQAQYDIPWLTQAIFGLISLIAVFIAFSFPETKGKNLPMTFEEVEIFFETCLRDTMLVRMMGLQPRSSKQQDNQDSEDVKESVTTDDEDQKDDEVKDKGLLDPEELHLV